MCWNKSGNVAVPDADVPITFSRVLEYQQRVAITYCLIASSYERRYDSVAFYNEYYFNRLSSFERAECDLVYQHDLYVRNHKVRVQCILCSNELHL